MAEHGGGGSLAAANNKRCPSEEPQQERRADLTLREEPLLPTQAHFDTGTAGFRIRTTFLSPSYLDFLQSLNTVAQCLRVCRLSAAPYWLLRDSQRGRSGGFTVGQGAAVIGSRLFLLSSGLCYASHPIVQKLVFNKVDGYDEEVSSPLDSSLASVSFSSVWSLLDESERSHMIAEAETAAALWARQVLVLLACKTKKCNRDSASECEFMQ